MRLAAALVSTLVLAILLTPAVSADRTCVPGVCATIEAPASSCADEGPTYAVLFFEATVADVEGEAGVRVSCNREGPHRTDEVFAALGFEAGGGGGAVAVDWYGEGDDCRFDAFVGGPGSGRHILLPCVIAPPVPFSHGTP